MPEQSRQRLIDLEIAGWTTPRPAAPFPFPPRDQRPITRISLESFSALELASIRLIPYRSRARFCLSGRWNTCQSVQSVGNPCVRSDGSFARRCTLRLEVAQQSLKRLLIGVVIFPVRKITNVPCPPDVGGPAGLCNSAPRKNGLQNPETKSAGDSRASFNLATTPISFTARESPIGSVGSG